MQQQNEELKQEDLSQNNNVNNNNQNGQFIEQQQQNSQQNVQQQQNQEQIPQQNQQFDIEAYDEQYRKIQEEQNLNPLISEIKDLKELEQEFFNSAIYLQKIQYPSYRKVRGDGSCFYRAYLFQIFERIVTMKDLNVYKKVKDIVLKSKQDLINVGYQDYVLDDFINVLTEKLDIASQDETNLETLQSIFEDKYTSDSLVMYLRFMTSGYLKQNRELYSFYIDANIDMDYYCQTEVDPIDKEADQLPMIALINYLEVPLNIVRLDLNTQNFDPQILTFPEGTNQNDVYVTLLFRPGHYDILYRG